MVFLLIIASFALLCFFSVFFRTLLFNPIKTAFYGVHDLYDYFKYKKYRVLSCGKIIAFIGLFGKGKTISIVHYVRTLYTNYNNKLVFDFDRMKWVEQRVLILSNVELTDVPYTKLESLQQIVDCANYNHQYDLEHDTRTCTIVLGDEFSVQLNSRQFKNNIDPLFLNTLLTCRHHHISLIYDAQRFGHVDALLRQVTSEVISCNKIWRVMCSNVYDAWELENASSPSQIKPLRRFGWFIRDVDYGAYDTLACVDNLAKKCKEGDLITDQDILDKISTSQVKVSVNTDSKKKRFPFAKRK